MNVILDASTIIAVITNESNKPKIIEATVDTELVAPESIHWEIGNVFSAMFKRNLITLEQALAALKIYAELPIRFINIELEPSLILSKQYNIYAYDAYLIECALKLKSPLLTLDKQLARVAEQKGVEIIRIES